MDPEARDTLKEWKLIQGMLGFVVISLIATGLQTGQIVPRDWVPLPASPRPDTTAFHIDAMRRAYHDNDLVTALSEAETVRMREPKNIEVQRVRAVCLLRLRRFNDARTALTELIHQNPRDTQARLALALALRGLGKSEEARLLLLKIATDKDSTPEQKKIARDSLASGDTLSTEFADAPKATPKPQATPSPTPLPTFRLGSLPASLMRKTPTLQGALSASPQPLAPPDEKPAPPPVDPVTITLPTPEPHD